MWPNFKFCCALNFSGTAVGAKFRFEVQLTLNANKYKIGSKDADTGYVTYFNNFATYLISMEWLKLQTLDRL